MSKKYLDFTGLSTLVSLIRDKFATKTQLEDYAKDRAPLNVYTIPSEYDVDYELDSDTIEALSSYIDMSKAENESFSTLVNMYDNQQTLIQTVVGTVYVDYMRQSGEIIQVNVSASWLDIDAESYSLSTSFNPSGENTYSDIIRYKSLSYLDSESPASNITNEDIENWNGKGLISVFTGGTNDNYLVLSNLERGLYFPSRDVSNTLYYKLKSDSQEKTLSLSTYSEVERLIVVNKIDDIETGDLFGYIIQVDGVDGRTAIIPLNVDIENEIVIPDTSNSRKFLLNNVALTIGTQTISGAKTFNTQPRLKNGLNPTADMHLTNKKYVDDNDALKQDIIQYETMPLASESTVGKVVQYIGTTDATYTNGYFYIGTETPEEGEEEEVYSYSWERLSTQPETHIPDDLKVFYINEKTTQSNPFIFSEHEPGIYFFRMNDGYGTSEYDWSAYVKGYPEDTEVISIRGYGNAPLEYFSPIGSGGNIASITSLSYWFGSVPSIAYTTTILYYNGGKLTSVTGSVWEKQIVDTSSTQTISAVKNFTALPTSRVVPTTNTQLVNKKYVDDNDALKQDVMQYTTMPTADETTVNKVVQYTGTTDSNYTNGFFYKGISTTETVEGEEVTTYSWENIDTQPETDIPVYYVMIDNIKSTGGTFRGDYVGLANCVKDFEANKPFTVSAKVKRDGAPYYEHWFLVDFRRYNGTSTSSYEMRLGNLYPHGGGYLMVHNATLEFDYSNGVASNARITRYVLYSLPSGIVTSQDNQTITGTKTFNALPISSVVPTTDNQLVNKKYVDDSISNIDLSTKQDVMQFSTMPTASAETVGEVVQYIGTTSISPRLEVDNLINGYFYVGASKVVNEETVYYWKQVDTSVDSVLYFDLSNITNKPAFNKNDKVNTTTVYTNEFSAVYNGIVRALKNGIRPIVYLSFGNSYSHYSQNPNNNYVFCVVGSSTHTDALGNHYYYEIILASVGNKIDAWNGSVRQLYLSIKANIGSQNAIEWGDFKIYPPDLSGYLAKTNTTAYTPTADYNPATKKYVDDVVGAIETTKRRVVQTLPTEDIATDTIYMVPKNPAGTDNIYDEYMYINSNWEKIGDTEVDLSDYLAKTNTTAYTPTADYNPATKKYVDDAISEALGAVNTILAGLTTPEDNNGGGE